MYIIILLGIINIFTYIFFHYGIGYLFVITKCVHGLLSWEDLVALKKAKMMMSCRETS